jgi:hypothetical protein
MTLARSLAALSLGFALSACGGAPPETKEPEPETTASSDEPAPASDDEASDTAEKKDEPADKEPAASEPAKPSRSPKDIVTAEGTLFSFSFMESDAYKAAETACSEKAGDDAKKKADCMQKEGAKIEADSMIFKKEDDGKWMWITLRRAGAKVTVLHKFEFEFDEETDKSITIKPKGRDLGTKRMAAPAKVVLEVNDSGFVIDDPKHGKMVYVGKLGQVGDPGR